MAWVRLDDAFASDPKVLEAGPLGIALQVAALCYCNRHLTDGKLPRPAAAALLSFEGLGMRMWSGDHFGGGEDAEWVMVAEDLVNAGMWHEPGHDCPECPPIRSGFYIHDYLKYQPSRDEVEAMREKKSEAGRKGGQASAQARASADGQARAQAKSKPDPVPVPDPLSSSSGVASEEPPALRAVDEERVEKVWQEIARRKLATARNVGDQRKWTRKVIENDRAELGAEARRLVATYPDINVSQLAGVLMGERHILSVLRRSEAS